MPSRAGLLFLLIAPLLLAGCVERALVIRSDPPGAQVYLDGKPVGTTPARIPFDHYGTREVMVRMELGEAERGELALAPQTRLVEVSTPWFQWFPIDFFSEFLWPGTIVDEHVVEFALVPHDAATLEARYAEAARAQGIRMPHDPPAVPPEEAAAPPAEPPE